MKLVRIALLLFLFAAASAAYVWLRSAPGNLSVHDPVAGPEAQRERNTVAVSATNGAQESVQPLEERGDAMLFEIEALQNTPFDEAITMPFD